MIILQLLIVIFIFNMLGLLFGVIILINKISQFFFFLDFMQKKFLIEIINLDLRIVEGVYIKDVYFLLWEQINVFDVILLILY